jgi:oligogalacturonide lyase
MLVAGIALVASTAAAQQRAPRQTASSQPPPKEWIDPDTGHRIIRLTDEPNSASLYFNQNGYTADNKKMVYTVPGGIRVLDLATRQSKQVVEGRVRIIVTGRKTQNVYYTKENTVYATDVDTLVTRRIGDIPARGSVASVNADETLIAGTYTEADSPAEYRSAPIAPAAGGRGAAPGTPQPQTLDQPLNKGEMMERRLAARIPLVLFTLDTRNGEVKPILHSTDWINHLEFSPTDPSLLMVCHEGPWHKVDRIWTIKSDGSELTKIHNRTMEMEIFGHEFWNHDGSIIWYDLQTPRGEDFWLAGYNVKTKERIWQHLQRNEWSIHFNVTPDGSLFCGDGGDPGQVAKAPDGEWIYLFRPQPRKNEGISDPSFIKTGVLKAEKLVNMSKHNYRLEPNVSFSPDQKWVIFRSNMFGPTYTFAVEVEKAK